VRVPRSGVTYSEQLEWDLAAIWANYRPDDDPGGFYALDGEMQSRIVAAYETHLQIEGVITNEQNEAAKRSTPRK
jgi:hypothetical protein